MATRCRAFDWAATALGPVDGWSQSLRTTASTVLTCSSPMLLFWGPALVQLYNDAFRPSLGGPTPDGPSRDAVALGAEARVFWRDVWALVGAQIEGVAARGEAVAFEDQLVPIERNGRLEEVWWTYSYSPVRDDDGAIAGVLVVCQEVTQRVRLERALAAERAQLAAIIDQAPAFMAVLRGPEHRFEHTNAAYNRLVAGRARAGRSVAEALPEVVEQGFTRLLDTVLATGEPLVGHAVPVRLLEADGGALAQRYVDFVYQALTDANGARTGVFVHGVDVTAAVEARREVERLLAESDAARRALEVAEQRLQAAFAQAPAAVAVTTGAEHRFVLANSHYARLVGRAVAIGATFREVLPEIAAQGYEALLDRVYASGEPHSEHESHAWLDKGGPAPEEGWYDFVYQPLTDVAGRVTGVMQLGIDVTAGVRARREVDAARAEAEAANRAKSEFLAVMSHELRTPLNAIGGYAELIDLGIRGPVTPLQREDLRRLQASQRHLLGLINEVLNYAKLETGSVQYDLADVYLGEVLVEAEALVAPQARAKGLAISVAACDPALGVRADAEKIRQILVNLLSNAVKFTDAGGQITLSCEARGSAACIDVADTGIGIAPDKLATIFEPFVQVRADLTRPHEGTGLGLAISRELARGMGGDLTVESTPGAGSVFALTLPRV